MIDRVDNVGVGLIDCQNASREISAILDVEDIFSGKYSLEISSPGMSRPLIKLSDWERFIGRDVVIKTNVPIVGIAKSYKGKIISVNGDVITVNTDFGDEKFQSVDIKFDLIEKANLQQNIDDFREILKQKKQSKKADKNKINNN